MTESSRTESLDSLAAPAQVISLPRPRSRVILDIAMLYVSKTGAVLVGILILPQFARLLGAEQFGIVAVIFSFQALLLTLDLGMSTLLSRDIAAADGDGEALRAWRTSEFIVAGLYAILIPAALGASLHVDTGLSPVEMMMAMLLFWILTAQNLGQTVLLAKHHFVAAGSIQFIGVAARGVATLLALRFVAADLTTFLLAQLIFAAMQTVVTRRVGARLLRAASDGSAVRIGLAHCVQMAGRGRPLVLFGIAGAAAMQLDKPIVSAYTSAAQVAPYYLATTLCLTPLALLAGPVAQFFQPRLVRAIASGDVALMQRVLRPFSAAIVAVTILPSALLWALREPIASAWLGHAALVGDVARYTAILLPGVAVGALGFVPYGILVARQDYRFQALASGALTVATLLATVAFARAQSIEGICWVYATYHATSTLTSWVRCVQRQPDGQSYARVAALQTGVMAGIAAFSVAMTIVLGQHLF